MKSSRKSGENKNEAKPTNDPTKPTNTSGTISKPLGAFEQTKQWFIEGQTLAHIKEALAAAGEDDPDAVCTAVTDYFATVGEADETVLRGWGLEAYRHLYQKMCEIGDYANAAKVVKEIMRA